MPSRYLRFDLRGVAERGRVLSLERLLAGADEVAAVTDWRADAFRSIAPQIAMPPVAATSYRAAGGPRDTGCVFVATPVHYLAEMSNVRLANDGVLSLDAEEAQALALDFNREWRDSGVDLWAALGRLFCGFDTVRQDAAGEKDSVLEATTHDPTLASGLHLQSFLPTGAGGASLRRLMSEIEMWLYDHALNRARRQRGQLVVSSLWLWGGGAPLSSLPAVQGGAAGGDVFFDAFPAGIGREADVMVVGATPNDAGWADLEAGWLAPTLADLRRGRLERLELSAGDRRLVISARWRRRFWRKAKPWWEYFE